MTTITVPAEITVADVAAMGEADELHRYERGTGCARIWGSTPAVGANQT